MESLDELKSERSALAAEHSKAVAALDATAQLKLSDKSLATFSDAFMRKAAIEHRQARLNEQLAAATGLQIDFLTHEIDARQRGPVEDARNQYMALAAEFARTRTEPQTELYRAQLQPRLDASRESFERASNDAEALGAELAQLKRELASIEVMP